MTPKSRQKSKIGVIFAKCAPMNPCPLLAQPLVKTDTYNQIKIGSGFDYGTVNDKFKILASSHLLFTTINYSKWLLMPIRTPLTIACYLSKSTRSNDR